MFGGAEPALATRLLPNGRTDRWFGHGGWAKAKIGGFVDAWTMLPGGDLLLAISQESGNERAAVGAIAFTPAASSTGASDAGAGCGCRSPVGPPEETVAALGRRAVFLGGVGRHGGTWLVKMPSLRH